MALIYYKKESPHTEQDRKFLKKDIYLPLLKCPRVEGAFLLT